MINISIVEDNPAFRKAIGGYLEAHGQFLIKGMYADPEAALKGLVRDNPDIAIVDIKMPGMTGIELITKVKQQIPRTQYLICTIHYDNQTVFNALQAGASGYILKDTDGETIVKSIIDLYNGGSPMSPYIARKVISHFQKAEKQTPDCQLTTREHEIVKKLAEGLLYKEIADQMVLSTFTVKNHLKSIYRKLHAQNKVEAINKYNTL